MKHSVVVLLSLFLVAVAICATDIDPALLSQFRPLPDAIASPGNPLTPEKIALGWMLYYEPRLSRDQKISCNSCHPLDHHGVDGERTSNGFREQRGSRNAPTVLNAAGHIAQFWDGRAPDVEAQAKGPILNPVEMALPSEQQAIAVLKSIPDYVDAFRRAFPNEAQPVSFDNIARAIGAFERTLVTPSRWDKLLRGETSALTDAEKAGFNQFASAGCVSCHNGSLVGGKTYQRLGSAMPWPDTSDEGRFKVTNRPDDHMTFKVASLRNVEKTGPYFHDGSVAALDSAVRLMAEYQLGRKLNQKDTASIVTWLKTLTGEVPAKYTQSPKLPPSTATTPGPGL